MAAKYDWGDGLGKVHTISLAQHKKDVAAKAKPPATPPPAGSTAPKTPTIPIGTYDSSLDAQLRQSQTTMKDLVGDAPDVQSNTYGGDIGIALQRGFDDWQTSLKQSGEDYTTNVDRTNQSYGNTMADIAQAQQRTTADYGTSTANLARNYDILGANQNAAARKAGVSEGGAFAQGQAKRTANQALDRAPIDTAYQRATQDYATQGTRAGEAKGNTLADLLTGRDRTQGLAGQTYRRGTNDLNIQGQRAVRDEGSAAQDIYNAMAQQSLQYNPNQKLTAGAPRTTPTAPAAPTAPRGNTLTAAPGAPGVRVTRGPKTKRGRKVTYTAGVNTP